MLIIILQLNLEDSLDDITSGKDQLDRRIESVLESI